MHEPEYPNLQDVYRNIDESTVKNLTNHAYWITDYYTKSIDRIQNRSTNLLGLLGVELGFLAQWAAIDFSNQLLNSMQTRILVFAALVSVLASLFWLLSCLRDRTIRHPSYDEIKWIIHDFQEEERKYGPLHTLLVPEHDTNENLFDNLIRVKIEISKNFRRATIFIAIFQCLIVALMFFKWM